MKAISLRTQFVVAGIGYGAVLIFAIALLYLRHLQELQYPADASGGMWAFGDALLYIFIVCLFLAPTFFVIWVISRLESVYKIYSRILLGVSLSAPVCLGALVLGQNYLAPSIGILCLYRFFLSPFILVGIGVSRLAARFDRAKKLVLYALLVEGVTLAIAVALVLSPWGGISSR